MNIPSSFNQWIYFIFRFNPLYIIYFALMSGCLFVSWSVRWYLRNIKTAKQKRFWFLIILVNPSILLIHFLILVVNPFLPLIHFNFPSVNMILLWSISWTFHQLICSFYWYISWSFHHQLITSFLPFLEPSIII